jgi:rubrerythrin
MFVFGTADDVFGMAVRIEENGKAFYSGAAEKTKDPGAKKLFEDLAAMEEGHVASFKSLRSRLAGSFPSDAIWDPEGLAESYLQVTADTHVFTLEAADSRLKQIKTPVEVIDVALQFEKDSVLFFLGMKDVLPDSQGKGEIDVLIQAEKEHIQMLSRARRQLEQTGTARIS